MELSDALDFIRDKHHGTVITLKRDGRPQSSNISYALGDDDVIRISVTEGRAKTKNLQRDPRVSLHVNRSDFYAYAVIEGDAELTPPATATDDDTVEQLISYFRAVAGEHDNWDEYRKAMVEEGRMILSIRPSHAYGMISR